MNKMFGAENGIYTINLRNISHTREVVKDNHLKDKGAVCYEGYEAAPLRAPLPPMASCRDVRPRLIYAIDAAIAIFVIALVTLIELGMFPHTMRGFWCNDASISYRYRGDSITAFVLAVMTLLPPLFLMFFTEHWCTAGGGWTRVTTSTKRMLRWYGEYLIGLMFGLFIVEVMKAIVGEPRPHFMDSCRPDPGFNCTFGTYVTQYKCTNTALNAWNVRDAMRSFPSGHSFLGCFTAVFMVWYLHNRARLFWGSRFASLFLQALFVCYGIASGVTRILDHRHHWWDVLVGATIGVAGSVLTVTCFCHHFRTSCTGHKELHHTKFATLVGIESGAAASVQNGDRGSGDRDDRMRHQSARRLLSDIADDSLVTEHQVA